MKRQGWTLCIGMVIGGSAVAQPPADGERYPPPPEMPGVVVSKPGGDRPTVTVTAMQLKTVAHQGPAPVAPAPALTATQVPYGNVATVQMAAPPAGQQPLAPQGMLAPARLNKMQAPQQGPVVPVNGVGPAMMMQQAPAGPVVPVNGMMAPMPAETMTGGCSTPACGSQFGSDFVGHAKLSEWFHFQSTSKQTGCYPYPYHPPLSAWFPCKPNHGGCSSCAAPAPGCAGGHCGGNIVPVGGVPQGPVEVSGGPAMRPVINAEMKPVGWQNPAAQAPAGPMMMAPVPPVDPLAHFKKLDGMSFTPGAAPMAAPVSRTK